jgi:hydroxymethylbilane synthase
MTRHLKLGTRRSLLATAQSKLIARLLESAHSGLSVELVGIDTRGDRTLDVPLSKMEGRDFFVAELDHALTSGVVDFTVHSMKDLSLERPAGLTLAAIPERANPRDIVLFAPDIIERLQAGKIIRLGTSSPRRIENVPPFLANALPQFGVTPQLQTREIRGNVHTRLSYLRLPDDDPRKIDGAVLAMAGLIRLWGDDAARPILQELLQELRWMVLPLAECPAAPAQGALAIECRRSDIETVELLAPLNCSTTSSAVARERDVLADWGGGCHQRMGATAEHHHALGELLFVRGRQDDGIHIARTVWNGPERIIGGPHWDGSRWRNDSFVTRYYSDLPAPTWLADAGAVFIAHSRALPEEWVPAFKAGGHRFWTSGTRSWLRLAAKGIWVEGCAEESGFEGIAQQLSEPVLGLPDFDCWHVLTHSGGVDGWPTGSTIATYSVEPATDIGPDHPAVIELQAARSFFWASGSQYDVFEPWVPNGGEHACRSGKTYNHLRERLQQRNIRGLTVYPSVAHWRKSTGD